MPFFGTGQPAEKACFSAQGGFYEESFSLEIFPFYQQHHIRFTTNGNRPTAQSQLYTEPLLLDDLLYSTSEIYSLFDCPPENFFLADSVPHCIVIRAAVFDADDNCISEVATNSYFIHSLGCDTHGLPVISVCADSLGLFDYETGILVPGINYDPLNPHGTGNYFMKGSEWERLCNFEFYELDNTGVNQAVGLRTHGKQSRWRQQKGLKIYAREAYGEKRIKHRFFEEIPINDFKHLCLKPSLSAWNGSGCKDYIASHIASQLDLETLASRASVLFLNGEYWGIYYVTEKPDERYLEDHFGIDIDAVTIINNWKEAEYGSLDHFEALYDWLEEADLSDDAQYAYIASRIDVDNFIDYYVFELFAANIDWPSSNTRFWQLGNGKWRWVFYDGDACLETQSFDVFANATYDGDDTYPASRRSTLFFRKLLTNKQFRNQFSSRFNQLVFNTFAYENTKPFFDSIQLVLQDEIPNQIARFGVPVNYETWNAYAMAVINRFLRERPQQILDELSAFLSVNDSLHVEFSCYPNPTQGELHLFIDADDFGFEQIAIYDLLGRQVYSSACAVSQGNNGVTLHPNLPSGIYVLKIGKQSVKIVMQ